MEVSVIVPYAFTVVFAMLALFSRRAASFAKWIDAHNPRPSGFDEESMAIQFRILALIGMLGAAVLAGIVTVRGIVG
jgi:hypothetical protein